MKRLERLRRRPGMGHDCHNDHHLDGPGWAQDCTVGSQGDQGESRYARIFNTGICLYTKLLIQASACIHFFNTGICLYTQFLVQAIACIHLF